MDKLRITQKDDRLLLEVHAVPRASRSKVLGIHDGRLKVALDAPPVDGAANAALLAFLARLLGLPKRNLELCRGESSRHKLVAIRGVTLGQLEALAAPPLKTRG